MKFTKMQGIGNDYIYVNCFEETVKNPDKLAVVVSDRHFGVGSDGLILIMPSEIADFKMRMFNSDGSESPMCGNGIRCVGKYVYDKNLTEKKQLTIETLAGIKRLELNVDDGKVSTVKVDMGEPILEPSKIPVNSNKDKVISEPMKIMGVEYSITCISMGNPHTVVYVEDIDNIDISTIGPLFENNSFFPKRTNVELVQVVNRSNLKMRVWERGSGETMACGTGACAVLVSSVINKLSERRATVSLLGGDLIIEWNEKDNRVFMTGPAEIVFEGEIKI